MLRKWFGIAVVAAVLVMVQCSDRVFAQGEPLPLDFLTVRTGALAAGGRQMEEGIQLFLKERNYTIAGRKVELIIADTGGNPAGRENQDAGSDRTQQGARDHRPPGNVRSAGDRRPHQRGEGPAQYADFGSPERSRPAEAK